MASEADERILRQVAEGGSMDYSLWSDLLPRLLIRLENIVKSEFPAPSLSGLPFSHSYTAPSQLHIQREGTLPHENTFSQDTTASSQVADKENTPPASGAAAGTTDTSLALPPPISSLLGSIKQTLVMNFSSNPPHTIQRFCELILAPKAHYTTLPSYLHALDRVVHVTSGANIYPLPAAYQNPKSLPNGLNSSSDIDAGHALPSLGSDESLGGALLTPIPWLRSVSHIAANGTARGAAAGMDGEDRMDDTSTDDAAMGLASSDAVGASPSNLHPLATSSSAGVLGPDAMETEIGVTQGELLRQEQRAGVVPVAQLAAARAVEAGEGQLDDEELPHARGPAEIGIEDTGPQTTAILGRRVPVLDIEAAVGRRSEDVDHEKNDSTAATPKREATDELEPESKRLKEGTTGEGVTGLDVGDNNGQAANAEHGDEHAVAEASVNPSVQ